MSGASQIALPAALAAALLSGCPSEGPRPTTRPAQADSRPATSAAKEGLAVSLELPKRGFAVGERFKIRLTVSNTSSRAIRIPAGPGAPIKVRIWRHTGMGWDEIRVYPQGAQLTTHPWQLAPGAKRSFSILLTVEPDWPTHDTLAVVAELNGRPDLQAMDTITIASAPTTAEADR
ncbi:MAG: hypothetical protein ISS78_03790 [Phycisphaerae bacterium]|nr:hypothetical protein [Phycisphaerae bacterium]